jgi:nudix-type nucleoside diphosphatase (YffH/AdpP family)
MDQVRVQQVETLSDDWYVLKKTTFDYRRRDGQWQTLSRETYDRGNGATILLYNISKRTVVLTRQFRFPTWVNGNDTGWLIEAAAGLLDNAQPADRIRQEVAEETGFVVQQVQPVFQAYMSPGSVTELIHFFIAPYVALDRKSDGGGNLTEGEDIEVLELNFDEAMSMVGSGQICDGKTIMLLQHAALNLFADKR